MIARFKFSFPLFVNSLYLFAVLNDTFAVQLLGEALLKYLLLIVAACNFRNIVHTIAHNRGAVALFWFFVFLAVSLLANWPRLGSPEISINLIAAILIVYSAFSLDKYPQYYMWVFVASVLFSSVLCIIDTTTISEDTFRRTGGMEDPNEFSLTVLISLGFLIPHIYSNSFSWIIRVLLSSIILIYIIALLYAGSKSALLVLGGVILVAIFKGSQGMSLGARLQIYVIAIVLTLGISWILAYFFGDILELYYERFNNSGTAYERFRSWSAGIELLSQNFVLGVGPGNYAYMVGLHDPSIVVSSRAAHNMYLQSLVELGVFGFCSFVCLLFSTSYRLSKVQVRKMVWLLPLISLLLMGMSLSLLYDKYVWILIALLNNKYIVQVTR